MGNTKKRKSDTATKGVKKVRISLPEAEDAPNKNLDGKITSPPPLPRRSPRRANAPVVEARSLEFAELKENSEGQGNVTEPEPTTSLDTLMWLLEKKTSDCTAAVIVNGRLLIAINSVSKGVREKNQTIKHIDYILQNLAAMLSEDTPTDRKKEFLTHILTGKLKGFQQGAITNTLNDKEFSRLVNLLVEVYITPTNQDTAPQVSSEQITHCFRHSKTQIGAAVALANKTFRRLWYLQKTLPSQDLKIKNILDDIALKKQKSIRFLRLSNYDTATATDHNWLSSKTSKGYAIVATHGPEIVHAEVKILDYLFAAGLISSTNKNTHYYIGVSIQCCMDCHTAIASTNAALKAQIIQADGPHHVPNKIWTKPIFLLPRKNNGPQGSRDYTLMKEIQREFEEKTQTPQINPAFSEEQKQYMSHSSPEKEKIIKKTKKSLASTIESKSSIFEEKMRHNLHNMLQQIPEATSPAQQKQLLEETIKNICSNLSIFTNNQTNPSFSTPVEENHEHLNVNKI